MSVIATPQGLLDAVGFIVLAYTDPRELADDDARGVTDGNAEGSMQGVPAAIIGHATETEWLEQCNLCGDYPWNYDGKPYVGFRKVICE